MNKLITLLAAIALVSYGCANIDGEKGKVGRVLKGTRTAINPVFIDNTVPKVKYDQVLVDQEDDRIIFAGPDEFVVRVSRVSFIEENKESPDNPYFFPSKNGVVTINISPEKFEKTKKGTGFIYAIYLGKNIPARGFGKLGQAPKDNILLASLAFGDTGTTDVDDTEEPDFGPPGYVCKSFCDPNKVPIWHDGEP